MSIRILCIAFLAITTNYAAAQNKIKYEAIHSGTPIFDDRGINIRAHGANVVRQNDRFYLFGEAHSDTSNAFEGFNCYSSADLYNWKFESVALSVQDTGRLGPRRVGERVKVMRCQATGEYVMFMHTDDLAYKDQCVGYAVSKSIAGPYRFVGPLLFNGKAIRKWDMGAFQDADGSGYILMHGGDIYKLASDYKSISGQVMKSFTSGFESPAIFRKGNLYYWLGSHLTSWERNDNYYYTSSSLSGPWTSRGLFAPAGTSTWNSQTTFVLPINGKKDTTFLFMGDRWSYPLQASAATYVWQPILVEGAKISIPEYKERWLINISQGTWFAPKAAIKVIRSNDTLLKYTGQWKESKASDTLSKTSDVNGDAISIEFMGQQIAVYAAVGKINGYAEIKVTDHSGRDVVNAIIDSYSNYGSTSAVFVSPVMKHGKYLLKIKVLGKHSSWSDKRKSEYGSKGDFFTLNRLEILK